MNKEQLQKEYQNGRRDFSNLNLSGLDLTNINLKGADLTGVNLSGACVHYANLTNANLTGANLSGAYLYWANLANTNLTNANLSNVDFHDTNLKGADLQGIQCGGTSFLSTDLTETKNLPSPVFSPLFIPINHPDTDLVNSLRSVTEGLSCYSEYEYPYDIFLWNTVIRGEFELEQLLKEMGHLKLVNFQDIYSVNSNSDTDKIITDCQILLDKIQVELFEIEIYQFETRDIREHGTEDGTPYIIIGRTVVGDWFGAILFNCNEEYTGTGYHFGIITNMNRVTQMSEVLGKNDTAMEKAEHINLISAVEEAGAEIEDLVWLLAEDRDIVIHELLLVADVLAITGVEDSCCVIQEDRYKDYKEDKMDEEKKLEQEKRKIFAQLVLNNLSNIRVYFIGSAEIDIYLIGETQNKDWLGIHTGVVWT